MANAQASRRFSAPCVWRACLVGLLVLLLGCGQFPPPQEQPRGEGPGGRSQPLALDPARELELGREAYREVLSESRGRILPADDPQVRRVREVCNRIIRAVGIRPLRQEINLRIEGYRFEWEVNVIRDRQINAFCLPAGKIGVFTGILAVARDDDQLATVLSHEISHALAHHASERLARERGSGAAQILSKLSYGRMQELEADHIGLFLMTFAGYNPEAAVHFWQRMQQAAGDNRLPEILSDHPSDAHRIEQMRKWVPAAKAAKQAFDEGRIATGRSP
jgi:predicted Zn-dependent protease